MTDKSDDEKVVKLKAKRGKSNHKPRPETTQAISVEDALKAAFAPLSTVADRLVQMEKILMQLIEVNNTLVAAQNQNTRALGELDASIDGLRDEVAEVRAEAGFVADELDRRNQDDLVAKILHPG
jgi:hypothetical protein